MGTQRNPSTCVCSTNSDLSNDLFCRRPSLGPESAHGRKGRPGQMTGDGEKARCRTGQGRPPLRGLTLGSDLDWKGTCPGSQGLKGWRALERSKLVARWKHRRTGCEEHVNRTDGEGRRGSRGPEQGTEMAESRTLCHCGGKRAGRAEAPEDRQRGGETTPGGVPGMHRKETAALQWRTRRHTLTTAESRAEGSGSGEGPPAGATEVHPTISRPLLDKRRSISKHTPATTPHSLRVFLCLHV